jgi:hypothetical protein
MSFVVKAFVAMLCCEAVVAQKVEVDVDWPSFLAPHDMTWDWYKADNSAACPGNYSVKNITYFNSGWCYRPTSWTVGAFLGNGVLGAFATIDEPTHAPPTKGTHSWVDFNLGRSDAFDTRPFFVDGKVNEQGNIEYVQGMLLIGQVRLEIRSSQVLKGEMRMSLAKAELTGTLTLADESMVSFRAFVSGDNTTHPVLAVEVTAEPGAVEIVLVTERAESARNKTDPQSYYNPPAPPPRKQNYTGNMQVHAQPLLSPPLGGGGGLATAWCKLENQRPTETRTGDSGDTSTTMATTTTVLATVSYSDGSTESNYEQTAMQTIQDAAAKPTAYATLRTSHTAWWADYYALSFISAGETRMESYYWIQVYKYGSGSHPDGTAPAFSNLGPWVQPTGWPGFWTDMNLQTVYWAPLTANRVGLARSLLQQVHSNLDALVRTAPPAFQNDSAALTSGVANNFEHSCYWVYGGAYPTGTPPLDPADWPMGDCRPMNHTEGAVIGNLLWVAFDLYQLVLAAPEDPTLRPTVLPILQRSVNLYLRMGQANGWIAGKGALHTPSAFSPEYARCVDCNYDVALLRWGLTILSGVEETDIEPHLDPSGRSTELASVQAGRHWHGEHRQRQRQLQGYYSQALADLVPAVIDNNRTAARPYGDGWLIGDNVSLSSGHRHYSHLFAFYPLRLVTWEDQSQRALIEASVDHWVRMGANTHGDDAGFTGFSYVALGVMSMWMGRPEASVGNISRMLFGRLAGGVHSPTTMYYEDSWGSHSMCLETPLSFSHWYQEMMLQSWEGVIKVFAGLPSTRTTAASEIDGAPPTSGDTSRSTSADVWSNASFHNLRAQGGVLVSAARVHGVTTFIQLLPLVHAASNGTSSSRGAGGSTAPRADMDKASTTLTLGYADGAQAVAGLMPLPWACSCDGCSSGYTCTFSFGYPDEPLPVGKMKGGSAPLPAQVHVHITGLQTRNNNISSDIRSADGSSSSVLLISAGSSPELVIRPRPTDSHSNYWGYGLRT